MKHRDRLSVMRLCVSAAALIIFGFAISQYLGQQWPPDLIGDQTILDIKSEVTASIPVTKSATLQASTSSFDSTVRSCLGIKCFDERTLDPNGISIDRVGLLAPLNSGGEDIFNFLVNLMGESKKSNKNDIELIYDTHVPAYGYGKNHGWSRIIRLTRRICPHAFSLVAGLNLDGSDPNSNVKTDSSFKRREAAIDIQTRQLVRWHCRLSHVAAHTKLLTVFVEDLVERPAAVLEMMLTFTGSPFSRPAMLLGIPAFLSELKKNLAFSTMVFQDSNSTSQVNMDRYMYNVDNSLESSMIPNKMIEVCGSAILDEINSTNGLSKWPCKSFRKIIPYGSSGTMPTEEANFITEKLKMSPPMVAANCSDFFVKCSVSFDNAGG